MEEQTTEPEVDLALFHQFIQKLSVFLLSSTNPHAVLSALLYSSGFDCGLILGTENTETAIARHLGISKQQFSIHIKRVRSELGITYCNTGKKQGTKETYQNNNYRKI
jgi:hypothetical protein